jgi:hypothetical protein
MSYNDVFNELQYYMLDEENMQKSLRMKISNDENKITTKPVKNKNNMKNNNSLFIPKEQDNLFWCFYIIKNGEIKYETINNKNTLLTKQMKIDMVSDVRKNKDIIKKHKFDSISNIESNLVNDNNINSIDDLPFFENLISLDIGLNNIQNINSLEKYEKLIYIYLNSNHITDIDSLKNNSIKYLNVSNNKISNIMIIESFKELESLNIKNNCIKVLPNLLNLKNLDYECLKLDWNNIIDVNGMKGFQLLKNMINSLSNK